MSNLGWTKADREADQRLYEQRKSEDEQQRASQASKDALAGVGVLVIAVAVVALLVAGAVFTFKALSGGGDGVDGDEVTRALDREITKAGEYGFAGYANYRGVMDEGSGDVAIQTSLFDKPENEQAARYMCSSMMTVRLQDGLEDLGRVRVLSSTDTTLAYCD